MNDEDNPTGPSIAIDSMPRFDAVFDYHRKFSELAQASQALAFAGSRYQALGATTWWSAWMDFSRDNFSRDKVTDAAEDPFAFVDKGLTRANKAMLELHHSDDFLAAQRELMNSMTRFRMSHKNIAELWQVWNHAPRLSDMDDLSETLYELRREVRRLRRQVARTPASSEEPRVAESSLKEVS